MNFFAIMFLQILFFHNVYSCWFAENIKKMACLSTVEVSAEGTDEWDKLHLFSKNSLILLKKNSFKRTPNLKELIVANVASIEAGTFNGLNKLDKLNIVWSELEEIPSGSLDNLPIRNLQIFGVKLKRIQSGIFNNIPDLRHVDLRNNSMNQIKKGVFDNTRIYKLYLGSNGLDKIENKSFENMTDLVFLSLYDNLLNSFSTERYLGTSLSITNFWLNRNKLTKITKDMFTTIPNLTHLYLEFNQIESIEPESFYKTPLLEYIDISNNKLRQMNLNMFLPSMKQLFYIAVHNNQLTYINKRFFQRTPTLNYITYGGNPFECQCSQELDNLMKEINVTRICDEDYYKGKRPSCVERSSAPKECLYEEDFTNELYELFQKAVIAYPRLKLKCDTVKGMTNAFLNDINKL